MERLYCTINEEQARIAHDMMSMSDYKVGSKTEEYRGYTKDGREMQVGDVVHFRCKNHPLSGKGVVFMGKEVDGLGEDPFRIRDTRTGRNNGRIYPYYDDAVYRIDGREGE